MLKNKIVLSLFLLIVTTSLVAQEPKMVAIARGKFVPLYGATTKTPVEVKPFYIG